MSGQGICDMEPGWHSGMGWCRTHAQPVNPGAECPLTDLRPRPKPPPRTIPELITEVSEVNQANGWRDAPPPAGFEAVHSIALLALISTEVSEAIEEIRNGHAPAKAYTQDGKPEGVPSELADIVIRCFDFADIHGIDLDAAITQKIAYNRTRTHRHGDKAL